MVTKLFYDSEFTGLTQNTTLISIAMISDCGQEFYAEFDDYDINQVDDWLITNVFPRTRWLADEKLTEYFTEIENQQMVCFGDSQYIRTQLDIWLSQFEKIEIWADCPVWDWMLLCQLYGGAFGLPKHIFYLPFDIATLFRVNNLSGDTNRLKFSQLNLDEQDMHNALTDARISKACHDLLTG